MKKQIILIVTIILLFSCNEKEEKTETTKFITKDIDNFYRALSLLPNADSHKDTIKILNEKYFNKASLGLRNYFNNERKNNNKDISKEYYKIIKLFPGYFESQKEMLLKVENETKNYDKYFKKIKNIYPKADFPTNYLCIGFFNTTGQMIYPNTVFIGLETLLRNDSTDYSEFSESYFWIRENNARYKDLGYTIIHENLHVLQKNDPEDNSILNQAIVEGAAVFLTEYFCGKESLVGNAGIDQKMIDYAKENRKTVWKEFKNDLDQPNKFSEWFWNNDSKYPESMGYYMGYMICKSYFENSSDKKEAIKELIEIKEPKLIYQQSKI